MLLIGYHTTMNDFFCRYSKCRRKTIDLIFKVLKPEVKNAFISVIEWPRIPAWYLKQPVSDEADGDQTKHKREKHILMEWIYQFMVKGNIKWNF